MSDAFVPEASRWFPASGQGSEPMPPSLGIGYDTERLKDIRELSLWLAAAGAGTGVGVGLLNRARDDIRGEKKKRMSLTVSALLGAGVGGGLGLLSGINNTTEAKYASTEKRAIVALAAAGFALQALGLGFDAYDTFRYGRLGRAAKASGDLKAYKSYKALQGMAAGSLALTAVPGFGMVKGTATTAARAARLASKMPRLAKWAPRTAKRLRTYGWAAREYGAAPLLDPSRYSGSVPGAMKSPAELSRIQLDHTRRLNSDLTRRARKSLGMPAPVPAAAAALPAPTFVPEASKYFGTNGAPAKQGASDPTLSSLYAAIANDSRLSASDKLETIARIRAAVGSGGDSMSLAKLVSAGLGGILGYWVSRYFGTGILRTALLSGAGAYAGNKLHGALTEKDPMPGWRILR